MFAADMHTAGPSCVYGLAARFPDQEQALTPEKPSLRGKLTLAQQRVAQIREHVQASQDHQDAGEPRVRAHEPVCR